MALDAKYCNLELHKASIAEFEIRIPSDGLDLHNDATLAVMLNTGHYNALYCQKQFLYSLQRAASADSKYKQLFEIHSRIREEGSYLGMIRMKCC